MRIVIIGILTAALCVHTTKVKAAFTKAYTDTLSGKATYYASYFEGRKTTSGQRYHHKKFTAAHRTLPFGSRVTVVNKANGKSIDVLVNDRGPFNKKYLIDISQGAAKAIGIYGRGVADVQLIYQDGNEP